MKDSLPLAIVIAIIFVVAIFMPDTKTKQEIIEEKEKTIYEEQDAQLEYYADELDFQESRNIELEGQVRDLETKISDLENYIYEFMQEYPEHEDFFYDALLKAGSSINEESIGAKHAREIPISDGTELPTLLPIYK